MLIGSGTTCTVAQRMGRVSVGIDVLADNCAITSESLGPVQTQMLEGA